MTRVFYASTLFGAMGLVAAIDSGMFGDRTERRVLIASNNASVPEITETFIDSPAFISLEQRFDDVMRWNDFIAPLHPSGWEPPSGEVQLLSRLLLDHLAITDGVSELVLESIAVPPSRTIGTLISTCPITVYSDGLMSYGPTRTELPPEIGRRTTRLLYLDLVPDVEPLLLRESEVSVEPISDAAFAKVVAEIPAPIVDEALGCPVIIGQYLSNLGVLTVSEEDELHARMLHGLAAAGYEHIVFKPHPAAGDAHTRPLEDEARRLGVRLTVAHDTLPAEAWFAAAQPEVVVSCFSTALFTAKRYFGIPTATLGVDLVLDRITPYENSNRIPLTIVDATVPVLRPDGSLGPTPDGDVDHLVKAVGFCMQAPRNADLREAATSYLTANGSARYFKKRRLESLGLLAIPARRGTAARRAARRTARRGYRRAKSFLETVGERADPSKKQ